MNLDRKMMISSATVLVLGIFITMGIQNQKFIPYMLISLASGLILGGIASMISKKFKWANAIPLLICTYFIWAESQGWGGAPTEMIILLSTMFLGGDVIGYFSLKKEASPTS
jgi:hypothetical protein